MFGNPVDNAVRVVCPCPCAIAISKSVTNPQRMRNNAEEIERQTLFWRGRKAVKLQICVEHFGILSTL